MAWVTSPDWGPGSLLHAVQAEHRLFADSKQFVDMSLRADRTEAELQQAFQALPTPCTRQELQALVDAFFLPPALDLEVVEPPDLTAEGPEWLKGLGQQEVAAFGRRVYALWRLLCRQVAPSVRQQPSHHTLLPLEHPFVIAGDRFRECYYWDSYWVVRGLVASDMRSTARALVLNLLSLVDSVGHVPNGTRSYYRNRSQPPLLSAMVMSASGLRELGPCSGSVSSDPSSSASPQHGDVDEQLLRQALPRLVRTWEYWTSAPKAVRVVATAQGAVAPSAGGDPSPEHLMSRYHAQWDRPRPESYREDLELAAAHHDLTQPQGVAAARRLWTELASAAESGWDFSSRWCEDDRAAPADLATTRTTQVVPVDLNAFLAMLAADTACIARHLGEQSVATEFTQHAQRRWASVHELMWCPEDGCWHDLLLLPPEPQGVSATGGGAAAAAVPTKRLTRALASNWTPLWAGGVQPGSDRARQAVDGLKRSGLLQPGGVATSLVASGQQWDAPNAWPPLQHMTVEALLHAGVDGSATLGRDVAGRWLHSVMVALQRTGQMHEKYDAAVPGQRGGGGEYDPQVGFGWTNGAVLDLGRQGLAPISE